MGWLSVACDSLAMAEGRVVVCQLLPVLYYGYVGQHLCFVLVVLSVSYGGREFYLCVLSMSGGRRICSKRAGGGGVC